MIALTDLGLRPERFDELTDILMTKVPQNLDLPGEGGGTVVCGCVDGAIVVPVRIERGSKFVRSNHFHRDELSSAPGESLVYCRERAGTEFVANVVMSPEALTRRTRGRESEYEAYSTSGLALHVPYETVATHGSLRDCLPALEAGENQRQSRSHFPGSYSARCRS